MPSSDNYTIVLKHCKTGIIKTAEKIKKEIKNSFAALSKQQTTRSLMSSKRIVKSCDLTRQMTCAHMGEL